VGDAIPGTIFEVSVDGGNIWETVPLDTNYVVVSSGNSLKLKITLNSSSTQISGAAILYK